MSLKPEPIGSVPEETARLAKAVFPEGSPFIKMRDDAADAVRKMKCLPPCSPKMDSLLSLHGDEP